MKSNFKFATNEELLEALGLSNISNICKVEIVMIPQSLPTIEVTRFIDNVETLTKFTIRKY